MKFVIISHVPHGFHNGRYFAYAPYVREMNVWTKFVSEVRVVAPLNLNEFTAIHLDYEHSGVDFKPVAQMDLLSLKSSLLAILQLPATAINIFNTMRWADHIHLRCPGNIGLIGCVLQIFFPNKIKTAKYAGNWDPKASQPFTYRVQRWILNNRLLTKNMQTLVYGEWAGASKNIRPFFTASYANADKIPIGPRQLTLPIRFIYVGTLSAGKRPIYALKIIQKLLITGHDVLLDVFGQGFEREKLEHFCIENGLRDRVTFHGNQRKHVVKAAYLQSHFIVLPSESEGWPKVIAEAMFWGCVPIVTPVSCVSYMLDNGNRGILLKMTIDEDVAAIDLLIANQPDYNDKVFKSVAWSRHYTLNLFETEIKALLNNENSTDYRFT